jgi:serine protease
MNDRLLFAPGRPGRPTPAHRLRRTLRAVLVLASAAALAACPRREVPPPPAAPPPAPKPLTIVAMAPATVEAMLEKRASRAPRFVPGQIIVRMKRDAQGRPRPMAAEAVRAMNLEVLREQTSGGEVVLRLPPQRMRELSAAAATERTLAAVRSLQQRRDVEYAQPNYLVHIAVSPSDPAFVRQWHYRDNGSAADQSPGGINLPTAWETNRGNGVVVAVIDTGILPSEEDIAGSPNLVPGYDMISDDAIASDGGGRDSDPTDPGDAVTADECGPGTPAQPSSWHGTHVAGTIGVVKTNNGVGVAGVNWNVKVLPVRVLGKCGGTLVDINDAIRWAAGLSVPGVPTNPTPARVINMSLGGIGRCSESPATQAAIDDAVAAGTTVVVAAGNEADDAANATPASCKGVITVAASDFGGNLVTRYSNFGARVDIMAPGGDVRRDDDGDGNPDGVLSTIKGGYAYYNGTSMAAPHVAGAVALLLSLEPTLTPAHALQRLKAKALPRTAAQCPRPCGAGLLNANFGGGAVPPPATAVTLTPASATLGIGQRVTLTATVTAGGSPQFGRSIAFASSNPDVANVSPATAVADTDGVATVSVGGVASGSATISARADGAQATAAVTVPPKAAAVPAGVIALLVGAALVAVVVGAARRGRRA